MAHGSHHIVPIRTLATVFAVLVALTIITVITAQLDLGPLNVPLALAIAGTKAVAVAAIFMALKYDNPVNMVVAFLGIAFAVVFLSLTLSDTALRGALGIQPAGHIPYELPAAVHEASASAEEPDATALAEQEMPEVQEAPARSGEALYDQFCKTCHSLDGSVLPGPTFQGIGQSRTREALTESILDPDATITEGFPPQLMLLTLNALNFYSTTSDAEIESLVTFLEAQ